MITLTVPHWTLSLEALLRLIIGISFVAISLELLVIRVALSDKLLFKRTLFMAMLFIGVCGVARLVSAAELMHLSHFGSLSALGPYEIILAITDGLSGILGGAFAIAMLPVTLNACGWNIRLGTL